MENKKNVEDLKCGLLTFEQYHGRQKNWAGSTRIRGRWLVKHWENAEIFKMGQEYDVVIYQKAYWVEHAKVFKGIKILDMCDPDWMHWQYRIKEMLEEVDAVTTSTEALASAVRKFTNKPVYCISDRVDLSKYIGRKQHIGDAKWVVWFGYSSNFEMLKPVVHFLKKFGLNLIVIADKGFSLPSSVIGQVELRNLPWGIDTVSRDILEGDIVVNPFSSSGKWKYKSNNKTITAWALGMPVAHDVEDLKRFISVDERKKEANEKMEEIKTKYDIKLSVKEYQDIIDGLIKSKTQIK